MASKPYATEMQLYAATKGIQEELQKLIDSGVISKNPTFDSAIINGILMINDEDCLIDSQGNPILINKQEKLVSGQNIKTVNGKSLLGEGNIIIDGSGTALTAGTGIIITTGGEIKVDFTKVAKVLVDSGKNQNVKTINGESILGQGNLVIDGVLKPEYEEYLKKVTYKTPVVSSFSLLNSSGSTISGGTYEDKTVITIAKFSHSETNVSNISGSLTIEGQTVTPSSTTAVVDFTTPISISSNKTFMISGKDTLGNTVSKSVSYTFSRYVYSNLTNDTTILTTGTKNSTESTFASSGGTFSYSSGQYLYLYGSKAGMVVETEALGQWASVSYESLGSIDNFTQANGKTTTMYVYRVGPFLKTGSAKYRLR